MRTDTEAAFAVVRHALREPYDVRGDGRIEPKAIREAKDALDTLEFELRAWETVFPQGRNVSADMFSRMLERYRSDDK